MICRFCQQDVDDPCHDTPEMRARAESHIKRCERALMSQTGMGAGSGAAGRE
ncbi:hypothetical protein ACFOYU_13245 [Microvirga sp. GCM10011540]|uniref:hypothetical protein n=1 Tax=Microvirga sp. GCM10011540 TaxID=3317338 RepID=UPI0036238C52